MGFFSIAHQPETTLANQLGCALDDQGYVSVDEHHRTLPPGCSWSTSPSGRAPSPGCRVRCPSLQPLPQSR
jgi:hypothetical protein